MEGKIIGFSGGMSGLAQIHFEDGSAALIQSGFGLRQVAAAFGSLQAAIGQSISYSTDEFGIMEGFDLIGEAA